jgi:hypothetical protein
MLWCSFLGDEKGVHQDILAYIHSQLPPSYPILSNPTEIVSAVSILGCNVISKQPQVVPRPNWIPHAPHVALKSTEDAVCDV